MIKVGLVRIAEGSPRFDGVGHLFSVYNHPLSDFDFLVVHFNSRSTTKRSSLLC